MHMNEANKPRPASSPADDLDSRIAAIAAINIDQLRALWRAEHRCDPPAGLTKDLLARALTYGLQERAFGGLSASTARVLRSLGKPGPERQRHIKVGSLLIREHEGKRHEVVVIPGGFLWEGRTYEKVDRLTRSLADFAIYGSVLNVVVWNKVNPGQGSFYRSQHELIGVFRVGDASHQNNIELGRHGRNRSNMWTYAGLSGFGPGRDEALSTHPTIKPVALVSDVIRDCTSKGDLVLDPFLGAGTTVLAAEKVGRVCYGLEYEAAYVDAGVRRWQAYTGRDAVLDGDGRTFDEIAAERKSRRPKPLERRVRTNVTSIRQGYRQLGRRLGSAM